MNLGVLIIVVLVVLVNFIKDSRADITGACWPLLTVMQVSLLSTICVLLQAALLLLRINL